MTTPAEFRESFERQGMPAVRAFIAAGKSRPGILDDGTLEAIRWLEEKDETERATSSAKRDSREEETLSIAKEANRLATEANLIASKALVEARSNSASARAQARSAKIAAIIATTAAIVASKEEIWALIARIL